MRIQSLVLSALALAFHSVAVAQSDEGSDRLREALRTTTVQLRNAQAEAAVLRSEKELAETENQRLTARIEALTRQAVEEKAKAAAEIAGLRAELAKKDAEAGRLAEALRRSQDAHEQAVEAGRNSDRANADAMREIAGLRRILEDRERKNLELHRLGMEILQRYEGFSTGRAISAREPFTGITRARLKVLVQDYQDHLDDHRISSREAVAGTDE